MNTIEISLAENYCPTWGRWEGVRELVQNYMDAMDAGFPGVVLHENGKLVLCNVGADITRAQMALFGETTKAGDEGSRGQFGEGFKIGLLALVREGLDVEVRTSHGTYFPQVINSEMYHARVLAFEKVDNVQQDGVEVMIDGIRDAEWAEFNARFLWDSPRDALLLDRPGEVFVRDIWIGSFPDYRLGYNFANMRTDRDRRLIDPWSLRYAASALVENAIGCGFLPTENALDLISEDAEDTKELQHHVRPTSRSKIAAAFKERHGNTAIAVGTLGEVQAAQHHGLFPVVLPQGAVKVLEDCSRSAYRLTELRSTLGLGEISEDERRRLGWAINLVEKVAGQPETKVKVVEFMQDNMLGRRAENEVYIARAALADNETTLQVIVEEYAHIDGGDGTKAHGDAVHRIYSKIVCATEFGREAVQHGEEDRS